MLITLRPKQEDILTYRAGKMGVSAVPGSGKTWTLSLLAADIIASGVLADDQEVLIVTLVNSAVDNFYQRVSAFVKERGLLPNLGYRVRTLHGLAHDIVRERPGLVGLDDKFQIIDEREADSIREEAAQAWLKAHLYELDEFQDGELEEGRRERVRRREFPGLVSNIAMSFIRFAKDLRLTPERLQERLVNLAVPLPLAEMGYEIYADYQRALAYRGAVDFDDLIRLALQALETDEQYLERLRYRWPYLLEDEAQDSSELQEEILKKLAGLQGNWVRVGDPNQAIYETFTTANPKFLRQFIRQPDVVRKELPVSGRSTRSIVALANHLVEWTQAEHPVETVRDALEAPPLIELTQEGDPQPNPPDEVSQIFLISKKFSAQEEIKAVADSLGRWLPEHAEATVAVLAPRNVRCFELVDELRRRGIAYDDGLLRSTTTTRSSANALGKMLSYLSDPGSPRKLAEAYRAWRRGEGDSEDKRALLERSQELLRKLGNVEDYLWPGPQRDWLEVLVLSNEEAGIYQELVDYRQLMQRWQKAILLPVDQLVLTLGQDMLTDQTELAVSHKLAVLLHQAGQAHPSWHLPELAEELNVIARNERRFLGFSEQDTGFDPDQHKGVVVVSTVHKAKGLEWDRVYLMSVNNYDYPSGQEYDEYIAERWFLRSKLNLEAETLEQLRVALSSDPYAWYEEGGATRTARLDYIRERLRLFYVGVTRARKELVVTWNTGRKGLMHPALPFVELQSFWEQYQ